VNIDAMRAEVFRRKPRFAALLEAWGDKTLFDHYGQDFSHTLTPSEDILGVIESEVAGILGADVATSARESIQSRNWVNTADHHGLLHHPYFYTTSLALSDQRLNGENKATVILPFGGVSLGNDSFPRGFSFHDTDMQLQKIFFKSLKQRRLPIYALSPMLPEELILERKRASSFALKPKAKEQLQNFFTALIDDDRVWSQKTYSAQLTVMNNILWRQLFGEERGDLVYLEIDSVVVNLLLEKHIPTETDIHRLIFNPDWREKFVDLFSGIQGSHTEDSGTHLFWYIDLVAHTRRRLVISGDTLVTPDGNITIPLTEETIAKGLLERTLMPSSALTLILVQEVEGLTCGGGPSQMDYLSSYVEQWATLTGTLGEVDKKERAVIWCGDCNLFGITDAAGKNTSQATLIDVLLHTDKKSADIDRDLSATMISDIVDAIIPALYTINTREKVTVQSKLTTPTIII
jgi:hypothetical protein